MLFICLLLLKKHTLKDISKSVFGVLFKTGIESNLLVFIAILALKILCRNAVERMHIAFRNTTLIFCLNNHTFYDSMRSLKIRIKYFK